jgi:phosphoglycolate phosphatase-like HAD superfamily hydrolase
MDLLAKVFGKSNFGIVSGRAQITAELTLGRLLNRFNTGLTFFIDDEISLAYNRGNKEKLGKLSKPHPHALLKVEKNTLQSGRILYIGDSMEDLIMVEQSNRIKDRFIAAGVYGYTHNPEELVKMFKEIGSYLIVESVNDIPELFEKIMREKL